MITETLTEYMKKIELGKNICFYKDKEKGIQYPLTPQHLLARVDYLELDKGELEKYKFDQKIDKKDYTMHDCVKQVPKYNLTKNKEDMYVITDMKFKGTHIWNVSNQVSIHETFENKEDANKLCNSINEQIRNLLKD